MPVTTYNGRMKKPLALLDLDGTLADYREGMGRHCESFSPSDDERNKVHNTPGFFRNLKPLPLGFAIANVLKEAGFKLHILTHGPKKAPIAWTEKFEWCQEHMPDVPVTIASDKSLVYGKVLVDDWPSYYERWMKVRPRGLVIVPAWPHNIDTPEGPNLIKIVNMDDMDRLRARVAQLVAATAL